MSETQATYETEAPADAEEAQAIDELSLYGVTEEAGHESPEQWQPRTEAQADWVAEKINGSRDRIARYKKTKADIDGLIRAEERRVAFFESRYGDAMLALLKRLLVGTKSKRYPLKNGILAVTAVPARIRIDSDDARLAEWAGGAVPDLVVTKTVVSVTVNRTDLAKRLEIRTEALPPNEQTGEVVERQVVVVAETGEPVPVAAVTPAGERLSIR